MDKGRRKFAERMKVMRDEAGMVSSISTWTEGVPTLLPRTDQISLVSDPENNPRVTFVSWERVFDKVGEAMKPQGVKPERWLVERFPTALELAAMDS
jgi:hypothetical protein